RKGAEKVGEVRIQLAPAREKPGEGPCINRMDLVHELSQLRESGDVRITEEVEAGVGKLGAQGGQNRERENEIPDRAAADHQDLVLQGRHYGEAPPEICMGREGSGDAAFAS